MPGPEAEKAHASLGAGPGRETPLQTDEDEAPLDCLRENPPALVPAMTSTETAPMDTATREGKRGDRDQEVDSGTSQGKGTQKFQRGHSKGRGEDPNPEQRERSTTSGNGCGSRHSDRWGKDQSRWQQSSWNAQDSRWGDQSRKDRRQGQSQGWSTGNGKEQAPNLEGELRELCVSLTRLVLRHDDQFSIDRTECGFILFLQTQGILSLVPELVKVSEVWKETRPCGHHPPAPSGPSAASLGGQARRSRPSRRPGTCSSWTTGIRCWDREEQRLRIRPDKEPMTLEQAKTLLAELQALILLPLTVQRFHSTRKMVRDHGGAVLPMMLQLGMRTKEAQVAWGHFHRICHSGLCRTVVMGMRGEKMGRSALATALQKMIEEPCEPYDSQIPATTVIRMPPYLPCSGPPLLPQVRAPVRFWGLP